MALTLIASLALLATPMDAILKDVPGAGEISKPEVVMNGAMRSTLRRTQSTASEAELEKHFTEKFNQVGLASVDKLTRHAIGGRDPETNIAYAAVVTANGRATDVAVTSFELTYASPAPLFPGASHVSTSYNEVSYRAAASAPAVESFYAETLKAAGWDEVRPMVFVKGDRQLFIEAIGFGEETSVQVLSRSSAP